MRSILITAIEWGAAILASIFILFLISKLYEMFTKKYVFFNGVKVKLKDEPIVYWSGIICIVFLISLIAMRLYIWVTVDVLEY